MAPSGICHKADRKFQSQDQSYQCQGQVAIGILQGFCFQDQGNVS